MTVVSNDPAKPNATFTVTGTGTGAAPVPVIVLDPVALDFGTVNAGATRDLTIIVRNTGNATLTVNSVASSNARFALTQPPLPFNVGPGSFQNAVIRFSPAAPSSQAGTLTFNSNDPANPARTLTVSGTGGAVPPGQIPIAVGQTVNGTLTTNSARSTGCSSCFTDVYRLTVTSAQVLDIRMNSAAFDAYLQLLDLNGSVLAFNDDSSNSTNARIVGTFQPGTYLIEATTAFEGNVGPYTLSVTAQ
jgi:hypothetical protein